LTVSQVVTGKKRIDRHRQEKKVNIFAFASSCVGCAITPKWNKTEKEMQDTQEKQSSVEFALSVSVCVVFGVHAMPLLVHSTGVSSSLRP